MAKTFRRFKVRPTTRQQEIALRAYIWERDKGRDRATGHELERVHVDWHRRGEVCHIQSRGSHPERKYDPTNCILLSARHHWLSDSRGGHLLKIIGTDASQPLTFQMFMKDGTLLWERTG